ncbi:hypothetical protein X797_009783 [Metarhizium robertsii]|uniref:Ubiquitin-like domain-containing protein n=1 Tax=Metarhizium robertsii TaxID=568076 RepID=A0A014N9D1_9HYPO|nr:hypothetical protein X797_009783 [Metarhizium robertsii]
MEVALTFGSLGDIIQLCQLAIQLGRAVGVGCGAAGGASTREYQHLRHDLDVLVVATYQQHELSPCLQVLDDVSKSVVDECASLIQDILQHLRSRYGGSLGAEGSGKKIRDIVKRIEWSVRETQRLEKLREKLHEGGAEAVAADGPGCGVSIPSPKSARVDNATVLARIDEVQRLASQARSGQGEILAFLKKHRAANEDQGHKQIQKLGEVCRQLDVQEKGGRAILAVARDAFRGIIEVKKLLAQVSQNVIDLQVVASNSIFIRPLDPTRGVPVILEDALGRSLEIRAQWIDTLEWEVLNGLLAGYFKGHKGHDMVQRQDYALEESTTGRDLNTSLPLRRSLRRGMKINMSMIFYGTEVVVGACPRCHTVTDAPEDVNVQCQIDDCGMWFRMQKQVVKACGLASTTEEGDGASSETLAGGEVTAVTSIPVEPGDFQRVRLLRQYEVPPRPNAQVVDAELAPPPAPSTPSNELADSSDTEPMRSELSESEASVPAGGSKHRSKRADTGLVSSNTFARAGAGHKNKHCGCTTDMFTYVYPDGHSETIARPSLCPQSRHGLPCRRNVIFQHPPLYIPYGVCPPGTAPPPPPLPAHYSAPPTPDRPFYPVTPGPMPCSVPSAQSMSSAGFDADVSDLSLPRSSSLPRKSRSRGSAVYINGVCVDGQKRHATAAARQTRLRERPVATGSAPLPGHGDAGSRNRDVYRVQEPRGEKNSRRRRLAEVTHTRTTDMGEGSATLRDQGHGANREMAAGSVVVPPQANWYRHRPLGGQGTEEEAQRRRLMERMMPRRRAMVEPASQRRRKVAYNDGVYRWE